MRSADVARLLLLSALWGGSFLFIRVAVPALGPPLLVELRVGLAGLALLAYAAASSGIPDLRAQWRHYAAIGVLNSAVPFTLISAAELHLSASFAAILNATSPIFGALIAAAWIGDRLTARTGAGLALGLLGVGVLVGWSPLPLSGTVLLSIGASLLGACSYGVASVYTRARVRDARPLGLAIGSQLAATVALLPLVPAALPAVRPSGGVLLCVLGLALASTALAYLLYFRLIVDIGPTRALTVTFLTPIFGVTWAALFLGEALAPSTLLGCAVVLAGTALVTGFRPRRRRRGAEATRGADGRVP